MLKLTMLFLTIYLFSACSINKDSDSSSASSSTTVTSNYLYYGDIQNNQIVKVILKHLFFHDVCCCLDFTLQIYCQTLLANILGRASTTIYGISHILKLILFSHIREHCNHV